MKMKSRCCGSSIRVGEDGEKYCSNCNLEIQIFLFLFCYCNGQGVFIFRCILLLSYWWGQVFSLINIHHQCCFIQERNEESIFMLCGPRVILCIYGALCLMCLLSCVMCLVFVCKQIALRSIVVWCVIEVLSASHVLLTICL